MFNFSYIRRELEAPILRGTLRNRAELILGPRQVGKSTMLDHLVQNQRFIKLTGEDEERPEHPCRSEDISHVNATIPKCHH